MSPAFQFLSHNMGGNESLAEQLGNDFPNGHTFFGFSNQENNCYVNSILQALFNLDPIINYCRRFQELLDQYDFSELFYKVPLGQFATMCLKIQDSQDKEILLSTHSFLKSVFANATQFELGQQCDAHELLISLFAMFDIASSKFNELVDRNVLPSFSSLFKGVVTTFLQCGCGKITNKADEMLYIPVATTSSLDESLEKFLYCDIDLSSNICHPFLEHSIIPQFTTLPKLLVIQILRFIQTDSGTIKNVYHVPFKTEIVLRAEEVCLYCLRSIIIHLGKTISSGHYVTLYNYLDKWYLANDSNVSVISNEHLHQFISTGQLIEGLESPTAYLMIYEQAEMK